MRTQEVLFNVAGQSFFYDPPEGRPDASPAPTVTVTMNMNGDVVAVLETATTGACALDAVNTTVSGTIAAGATTFTVASGTGITRGRRYLLTGADGDREWIEVIAVTGATVTARRPLINSYANGDAFVGCRITVAVDPTWGATQAKISDILATSWRTSKETNHPWGAGYAGYRLRWSYSFNGSPTLGVSYADLVRYNAKSLVTPLDVEHRFAGWIDRLPSDNQEDQGAGLVDEAFHAVRMDAMGDEEVVRRIRNTEILRELVVYRANLILAEQQVLNGTGTTDVLKTAREIYAQRYDQLMREPKFQVDQIGDGSAGAGKRAPVWRR